MNELRGKSSTLPFIFTHTHALTPSNNHIHGYFEKGHKPQTVNVKQILTTTELTKHIYFGLYHELNARMNGIALNSKLFGIY